MERQRNSIARTVWRAVWRAVWKLVWVVAGLLGFTSPGLAAEAPAGRELARPFELRNTSPLTQVFGLPGFAAPAQQPRWRLTLDAANSFTGGVAATEQVRLDGETALYGLHFDRRLGERWELGAELPWVVHSGGAFDGLIDGWHDLFGLPDGGRPLVARNQLEYRIQLLDADGFELDRRRADLGDLRVWLGRRWQLDGPRSAGLRGHVKLPTGSVSALSGSGAADLALSFNYLDRALLQGLRTTLSLGAGLVWLGDGDLLPSRQERWLATGHLGLSTRLGRRLALIGQLDAHSAPFEAALSQLGETVLQGTLGGRVALGERYALELAVVEDLNGALAADVVFRLGIEARW